MSELLPIASGPELRAQAKLLGSRHRRALVGVIGLHAAAAAAGLAGPVTCCSASSMVRRTSSARCRPDVALTWATFGQTWRNRADKPLNPGRSCGVSTMPCPSQPACPEPRSEFAVTLQPRITTAPSARSPGPAPEHRAGTGRRAGTLPTLASADWLPCSVSAPTHERLQHSAAVPRNPPRHKLRRPSRCHGKGDEPHLLLKLAT